MDLEGIVAKWKNGRVQVLTPSTRLSKIPSRLLFGIIRSVVVPLSVAFLRQVYQMRPQLLGLGFTQNQQSATRADILVIENRNFGIRQRETRIIEFAIHRQNFKTGFDGIG